MPGTNPTDPARNVQPRDTGVLPESNRQLIEPPSGVLRITIAQRIEHAVIRGAVEIVCAGPVILHDVVVEGDGSDRPVVLLNHAKANLAVVNCDIGPTPEAKYAPSYGIDARKGTLIANRNNISRVRNGIACRALGGTSRYGIHSNWIHNSWSSDGKGEAGLLLFGGDVEATRNLIDLEERDNINGAIFVQPHQPIRVVLTDNRLKGGAVPLHVEGRTWRRLITGTTTISLIRNALVESTLSGGTYFFDGIEFGDGKGNYKIEPDGTETLLATGPGALRDLVPVAYLNDPSGYANIWMADLWDASLAHSDRQRGKTFVHRTDPSAREPLKYSAARLAKNTLERVRSDIGR